MPDRPPKSPGEDQAQQRDRPIHIIIFVGPSGCGKSTLANNILRTWPDRFAFSVSHTTRKPRMREEDGKHYHFVSKEKFLQLLSDGMFAEYSKSYTKVRPGGGQSGLQGGGTDEEDENTVYYGTSKMALQAALSNNRIVVMDTDINGAMKIRRYCDEMNDQYCAGVVHAAGLSGVESPRQLRLHLVFVMCPNLQVGEQRLRDRGTESLTSLQRRFLSNRECIQWYKAHPGFFHLTLVNDKLERCLEEFSDYVRREIFTSPQSKL